MRIHSSERSFLCTKCEKDCPFKEDSSQCRYGKLCEITYCMHKHEIGENEAVSKHEEEEQKETI